MTEHGLKAPNLLHTKGFIGEWCDASGGKTYKVVNPATGKDLATVPDMGADNAIRAVDLATETLPYWKALTVDERGKILHDWAALIRLKIGNGLDEGVQMGPLISMGAVETVELFIEDALNKGAKLVTGGKRHDLGLSFFEPTVLTDVTPEMMPFKYEIFGPVAAVCRFKTEEEVIALANNTIHGLAGTADMKGLRNGRK